MAWIGLGVGGVLIFTGLRLRPKGTPARWTVDWGYFASCTRLGKTIGLIGIGIVFLSVWLGI